MKIVLSNVSPERAEDLAKALVTERLAACVNLLPIRSVYRWDGALQVDPEVTLFIKVSAANVAAVRDRIRELHSYSLPEILVLDVDAEASYAPYVQWVREQCEPPPPGDSGEPRPPKG